MKPGPKIKINKTEPLKYPQKRPRKDGFGPYMAALTPLQRKYIIMLYEEPGVPKCRAFIAAGYNGTLAGAKQAVQRFNHNQLMIDAIREYGEQHFTGDLPLVMHRYHQVIDNPQHRGHTKLLVDYMDRVGPSTVKETKSTIHHTFDRSALIAKIATILERQPEAIKMIGQSGEQPLNVVEADYSVEAPESD